jgi:dipeptide transport system permease protein
MSPERHAEDHRTSSATTGRSGISISIISGRLLQGDFGNSLVTKRRSGRIPDAVSGDGRTRLCAIIIATLIGIPAGISPRSSAGRGSTRSIMGVALVGYSMPIFWWGLLLIIFFSGILAGRRFRAASRCCISSRAGHRLHADRQPAVGAEGRLHLGAVAPDPAVDRARHHPAGGDRAADPLGHARGAGRGLRPHRPRQGPVAGRVIGVHALRNALIPVITTIGLQVGVLLAGAILTETIFSWPGIGKWMIDSIFARDYPVVQGGLLLIAG